MNSRFDVCLKRVLHHEGGKVDDKLDRGGRTNKGVTQRVYDTYRKNKGLSPNDVWEMADSECRDIYLAGYWIPTCCGSLPIGVDYCVFDTAINSGVRRAGKLLQLAIGMSSGEVDGIIGAGTMRHVQDLISSGEVEQLIPRYIQQRRLFLQSIVERDSTQQRFAKGWANRIDGVEKHAKEDRA